MRRYFTANSKQLRKENLLRIAKAVFKEGFRAHGRINWIKMAEEIDELNGFTVNQLVNAWYRGPVHKKLKIPGLDTVVDSYETLMEYYKHYTGRGISNGQARCPVKK